MKIIAIQRFFEYGQGEIGEENYLIRLEEFRSLRVEVEPPTGQVRIATKDFIFEGFVLDDVWSNFCEFLRDDDTLAIAIYDEYHLIPNDEE